MAHLQGIDSTTKRSRVLSLAKEKGVEAGAATGVFSTAGVAALTKFSPWFRKSTSVSAKTALAISPIFLACECSGSKRPFERAHGSARSDRAAVARAVILALISSSS
eukprot:jgi/Undpi1/6196/HiC_scaffold_20.g08680.m1